MPKFGSQLPVFIEPVSKGGQNYNFTVPWGPFLLFDSDSRQEWEVGANMEGYEKLFIRMAEEKERMTVAQRAAAKKLKAQQ